MPIFRILGITLALIGAVTSVFPQWFGPLTGGQGVELGIHEAIERRVRAGMLLGAGLALIAVHSLRPWGTSIPTAILYLLMGALAARLFGLIVDGTVPKQWLLVAVETLLMTLAALWLWRAG